MINFPLSLFTDSVDFPIHIQYGFHEENDCYPHTHEDFSELVVVLDGSAQHIVNNESYKINKGDAFVINQFTAHSFSDAVHLKICNIMFKPEITFANVHDMKKLTGFQALFVLEPHYSQNHHFCSRLTLNAGEFTAAEVLIHEMMETYTQKETGWKDSMFALFRILCIKLSKFYHVDTANTGNEFVKLAGAVAYMEKNYCSSISAETLAGIAGYSQRQFLRLFKSVFNITPNLYIISLRMKKAQQLLKKSDMTISEAAWHCGYDDQNYFSRVFRKHVGMSPREYQALNSAK